MYEKKAQEAVNILLSMQNDAKYMDIDYTLEDTEQVNSIDEDTEQVDSMEEYNKGLVRRNALVGSGFMRYLCYAAQIEQNNNRYNFVTTDQELSEELSYESSYESSHDSTELMSVEEVVENNIYNKTGAAACANAWER